MPEFPEPSPVTAFKDGRSWRVGTAEEVAWINAGTTPGLGITASIPPVFEAYATIAFPWVTELPADQVRPVEDRFDDAVVRVLRAHTTQQPWWLGFLDTGATDVVLDDAPRVTAYAEWSYVLVEAGPDQARSWRDPERRWFTMLPELMFPADRSWLLASLWDDAWTAVGGSEDLITALLADPDLRAAAERTDPSVPDMWPSSLPEELHERLGRRRLSDL